MYCTSFDLVSSIVLFLHCMCNKIQITIVSYIIFFFAVVVVALMWTHSLPPFCCTSLAVVFVVIVIIPPFQVIRSIFNSFAYWFKIVRLRIWIQFIFLVCAQTKKKKNRNNFKMWKLQNNKKVEEQVTEKKQKKNIYKNWIMHEQFILFLAVLFMAFFSTWFFNWYRFLFFSYTRNKKK